MEWKEKKKAIDFTNMCSMAVSEDDHESKHDDDDLYIEYDEVDPYGALMTRYDGVVVDHFKQIEGMKHVIRRHDKLKI